MNETEDPIRPDLRGRDDIVLLVDRFYDRVRADQTLGPIFDEIAQVNWSEHLPKLYAFWETILFRTNTFRGNPIGAHARLIPVADMSLETFNQWLTLFRGTVHTHFEGPNADHLIRCAEDMANVIYSKIHGVPDPRFDPAKLTPEQKIRYTNYRENSSTH